MGNCLEGSQEQIQRAIEEEEEAVLVVVVVVVMCKYIFLIVDK